jgi:hypothetical protein
VYKPSLLFDRTAQERTDPFLFWKRDDQSFFAAGACHILAEMFRQLHYGEDYQVIFIKPINGMPGTHIYVSNGTWAFDHNGWTREQELLDVSRQAYTKRYPGWDCERIVVTEDLETFSRKNNHRQPWQFAYLPWERAYKYIHQFPATPPAK